MQAIDVGLVVLSFVSYFSFCHGKAVIEETPGYYRGYEYTFNFQNDKHSYRPLYDNAYVVPRTEDHGSPNIFDNQASDHNPFAYTEEYDDQFNKIQEYVTQHPQFEKDEVFHGQILPPSPTEALIRDSYRNSYKEYAIPTIQRLEKTYKNKDCLNCHELENAVHLDSGPYIKGIKRKKHNPFTKKEGLEEKGGYLPTIKTTAKKIKKVKHTNSQYSSTNEENLAAPVSIKIKNKVYRKQEVKNPVEYNTKDENPKSSIKDEVAEHDIDYLEEKEEAPVSIKIKNKVYRKQEVKNPVEYNTKDENPKSSIKDEVAEHDIDYLEEKEEEHSEDKYTRLKSVEKPKKDKSSVNYEEYGEKANMEMLHPIKIKNKKFQKQEAKENVESYTNSQTGKSSDIAEVEYDADYHEDLEEEYLETDMENSDVVIIRPKSIKKELINEETKCVGKTKSDKEGICVEKIDSEQKISKPNKQKVVSTKPKDSSSVSYVEYSEKGPIETKNEAVPKPDIKENIDDYGKLDCKSDGKRGIHKGVTDYEYSGKCLKDMGNIEDLVVIKPKSSKEKEYKDEGEECEMKDGICIDKKEKKTAKPNIIKNKDATKAKGASSANYEENSKPAEPESIISDGSGEIAEDKNSKKPPKNVKHKHDVSKDTSITEDKTNENISDDFRRLPFLSSNIWSLLSNPEAKDHKLIPCLTRSNESGNCMYIQQCQVPNIASSLEQLLNHACVVDDVFIGVCCPEFPVETVKVQWDDTERNSVDPKVEADFDNKDCGTRSEEASNNQIWPWKAQIVSMSDGKVFCGGVVIREDYILTAAHCTTKIPNNQVLVRLGQHDEPSGEDLVVTEIKRHAQYNSRNMQNDIALLKLGRGIPHTEHINAVCLPESDDDYSGEKAVLLGWRGSFDENRKQSEKLEVLSDSECRRMMNGDIHHSVLCTEARNANETTCNADSGAPLIIEDDGRYKVIGILSWNRNDCDKRFPPSFSRVSNYVKWIQRHAL